MFASHAFSITGALDGRRSNCARSNGACAPRRPWIEPRKALRDAADQPELPCDAVVPLPAVLQGPSLRGRRSSSPGAGSGIASNRSVLPHLGSKARSWESDAGQSGIRLRSARHGVLARCECVAPAERCARQAAGVDGVLAKRDRPSGLRRKRPSSRRANRDQGRRRPAVSEHLRGVGLGVRSRGPGAHQDRRGLCERMVGYGGGTDDEDSLQGW